MDFADREDTKKPGAVMYICCLLLHAIFVVCHLVALIVAIQGTEKHVIVNNAHFSLVSTAVTVIPQIVSTLFLTVILFLTQKLATMRNLTISQSLTATHDQISAWSGLGKALKTVLKQLDVVSGPMAIAVYLGCITIVHITTPSILSLHPIELSVTGTIPTSLSVPNMSVYIPLTSHGSTNAPQEFWGAVSTFLGVFAANNTDSLSSVGLSGNTLYDVVSNNNASMPIVVNATTFNVSCGYIPDWTVDQTLQANASNPYPVWNLTNSLLTFSNISSNFIAPSSLVVYNTPEGQISSTALPTINWPYVMFISTTNFTDSSGSVGEVVSLGNPLNPDGNGTWQQVWSFQMIGCSMSLIQSKVTVDPTTRLLTSSSPILHKNSSTWSSWSLPENITVSDPIEEGLYSMFGSIFFSAAPTNYPGGGNTVLSAVEEFLALELNVIPDLGRRSTFASERPPPPPVTLHDLENAVAAVSAAAFYSALHVTPTALDDTDLLPIATFTQQGESEITYQVAASRLQLNIPQTIVGLIASIILMILAMGLGRLPDNAVRMAVNDLGMLQTMWLSNRHSGVRRLVAAVKQPTDENLRMVGMQEICLADIDSDEVE